jgi:hypothetical protein
MGGRYMRRIQIPLGDGDFQKLVRLSEQERRHPRDQASVMLSRDLAGTGGPPAESEARLGRAGEAVRDDAR